MKKIKTIVFPVLGLFVMAAVTYLIADQPHTPPFKDKDGKIFEGSIASTNAPGITRSKQKSDFEGWECNS